jgi:hypothetical protein
MIANNLTDLHTVKITSAAAHIKSSVITSHSLVMASNSSMLISLLDGGWLTTTSNLSRCPLLCGLSIDRTENTTYSSYHLHAFNTPLPSDGRIYTSHYSGF